MNTKVDLYLAEGCGRCSLAATPACKVHSWGAELAELRRILLEIGLTEELKWSHPCYTVDGKNVALLGAFKEYCAVMLVKGALLDDPEGILVTPTENSQSGRQIRFTKVQEVARLEPVLKAYFAAAIHLEKSGAKVAYKKTEDFAVPEEFQKKLEERPELKSAFFALTPGRQRGYLLHFAGAKQSKTRESRIEKCIPGILAGKGWGE